MTYETAGCDSCIKNRIYGNKRPGRLIFRGNKKHSKTHRFCVLPPLEIHPSKLIGFVYSPLWKITHQSPSVLCTPPFEKSPITTHRFCVLTPLKNHCFWWALISANTVTITTTVMSGRFAWIWEAKTQPVCIAVIARPVEPVLLVSLRGCFKRQLSRHTYRSPHTSSGW